MLLEAGHQVHLFICPCCLVSLLNMIYRQFSRQACSKHCLPHSAKGHGSKGRPSVPWHMISKKKGGRVCYRMSDPLAFVQRDLQR